jgi:hypothetical protein
MNLHEQLGALEVGVDQLLHAVVAEQADHIPETPDEPAALPAVDASASLVASASAADHDAEAPAAEESAKPAMPTLQIDRPAQNEITMTIGDQTVALRAEQIGMLIEELANARASMTPEPPPGIPPGWRFVSTKNPVMAVQKQSNGDRLLIMRHTGHGWVPFTFSPDVVIQMYMMLSQA